MEKKSSLASATILESLRKASAWLGFSDLNQGGVSHFLGQGGPPIVAARVALSSGMSPIGSGKGWCLFSLETVWALAWEEQLRMPVLPWEGSLGAERVRAMEVFALIVNGKIQQAPPY